MKKNHQNAKLNMNLSFYKKISCEIFAVRRKEVINPHNKLEMLFCYNAFMSEANRSLKILRLIFTIINFDIKR